MEKKIFVICGEPSGELRASELVKALKNINPEIKISAIGSKLLKDSGAEIFFDINGLSVMGFFDVLKSLPKFFNLKKLILNKISLEKPDAIILVDFSGFNLRLAKAINNSIPTIYYVSPQVWASRPGRIKIIKKYIKKMIVIFKFEQDFYRKFKIEAVFVGHPLIDIIKPIYQEKTKTTIALLPGSRKQEIKRILPIMLESVKLIKGEMDAQFVIAKSPGVAKEIYLDIIKDTNIDLKILEDKTYEAVSSSDFALVCSGTATLETAIIGKPFAIVYKTSLLNYLLYRPLVKVPFIGIVNIIAGKEIIPEFIQFNARPRKIADFTVSALRNPAQLQLIKEDLAKIKSLLGQPGAANRAAGIIIDFLKI